jgi:hypothetical protein
MSRLIIIVVAIIIVVLGALIPAASASAQEDSDCSARLDEEPANGETITVSRDSDVRIDVTVPDRPARNSVYLEFFGIRLEVDSGDSEGGTWSGTVPVEDLALWGVGLYKVVWESRDEDGDVLCSRSASIRVEGFPLASVAGAVGGAAIIVGLMALTFTCKTTINEGARWAIKVVGRGKAERDAEESRLTLKPTLSVSQTLLGTLWGTLLGGGTLATLQESALSLPTVELALELVLPFAVLGLLAGSFRLERQGTQS